MGTGVVYALDYIFGFVIFGFFYGLLELIKNPMEDIATSGNLLVFANWLWGVALIVYIIFGMIWLPRKLKEQPPSFNGGFR